MRLPVICYTPTPYRTAPITPGHKYASGTRFFYRLDAKGVAEINAAHDAIMLRDRENIDTIRHAEAKSDYERARITPGRLYPPAERVQDFARAFGLGLVTVRDADGNDVLYPAGHEERVAFLEQFPPRVMNEVLQAMCVCMFDDEWLGK